MLNLTGREVAIGNLLGESDGSDMSDESDWSDQAEGSDGSVGLEFEVGGEWVSCAYDMTLWCKCGYNGVTICIY